MSATVEKLLTLAQAADRWERAHSGSRTADAQTPDQHRVTPRAELHEAERALVAAVLRYRSER